MTASQARGHPWLTGIKGDEEISYPLTMNDMILEFESKRKIEQVIGIPYK